MPVLTKVAYDDGASVGGVLSVRSTTAALLLLLLLGGVGYAVEAACYFAALPRISAGLTALLLYAYPAIVVVLSAVLARRAPSRVPAACVVIAMLGTVLTIGPVAGGQWTGVVLGLTAACCYSTYIVVSAQVVAGLPPVATSAVVMAGAATSYDGYVLITRAALPSSADAWWALAGVTVLGTVVAV